MNTFAAGTSFGKITIENHQMTGNGIALNAGISATAGVISLGSIKLNNAQTFTVPASGLTHVIGSAIDTNGATLTLDRAGTLVLSGVISGTGRIDNTGAGTAILTGNNTYTGDTRIFLGTLVVNGSQPASAVLVVNGSTLGGTGTVGHLVTSGGSLFTAFIAPGSNGPGILKASNGVNTDEGSGKAMLKIDLNGTAVGTGYDQLDVNGAVNLRPSNTQLSVTIGSGFTPAPGDTFVVVKNDGIDAVTGIFDNLPEGATFIVGSTTFAISYIGGDGNDAVLHVPITRTWGGNGTDNRWMTPANWVGGVAPAIGDSLVFPESAGQKNNNFNNFPAGTTFNTITFTGGGYDISGNAINVDTRLVNNSATFTLNALRMVIGGTGGVTNEANRLNLEASNTYTGTTVINSGFLTVNGDQPNSPVTLAGGTLVGGGTVGAITVTAQGANVTIQPGSNDTAPALRVIGNLNMTDKTNLVLPVTASTARKLQVTGGVTLGGADVLPNFPAASPPSIGSASTIINNDGTDAIVGTFGGINGAKAEGAVIFSGTDSVGTDVYFRISYVGGDGNDVTLTRVNPPTLSIGDVSVVEGNTGTRNAAFPLTLSYPVANRNITYTFSTADGTAIAGIDYISRSGTFGIGTGVAATSIFIQVNGDTTVEPDETFFVNVTSAVGASIADGQGVCTILNDDAAPTPTPTPNPTVTPTPTPGPTASPTPTPTPNPTATPSPSPTPTPGLAANVSTRLPVGKDDNVLIEGFIVQGPAGSTKKIIVRAIGPFLQAFGITDFLANPTLEIFNGTNARIASNDNWKTTQVGGIITSDQSTEINANGLAPADDLESAIIANLTPGQYTAVVRGAGNTAGTGIVDAFDLSTASPARLVNVATRGLVQPGDKLLIAGLIVQNGSVRIVVRAIGPSLTAFGINNALPDTTLQLRDQNGTIVRENDDWQTDQKLELEATGLQPTNNLEAALIQTVPPGQYTAQVRGKPEATGTAVVEIYFLQ